VGVVTAVVFFSLFVWLVSSVLLLVFAGILLAIFLRSLSEGVREYTALTEGWSLVVVLLGLAVLMGLGSWLLTPSVAEQIDRLSERIPRSLQQLEHHVQRYEWSRQLFAQAPKAEEVLPEKGDMVATATGVFSTTLGALASFVIFMFLGLFFAAEPRVYKDGLVRLVPIDKRERAHEVLHQLGSALQWWLIGKVFSMLLVGVLTALGLWLLEVELALTLGLIAALFTFIPNIGPVLSAVPAVLLALLQSPTQAFSVVLLYLAIQTVESYLITPLIQQRTVSLPPALTITAQVALGVLLGGLGLVLATPLMVCLLVLVQMLYIHETLGDSIETLGNTGEGRTGSNVDTQRL
jgi:predicted PurR-regulated permease PerM